MIGADWGALGLPARRALAGVLVGLTVLALTAAVAAGSAWQRSVDCRTMSSTAGQCR